MNTPRLAAPPCALGGHQPLFDWANDRPLRIPYHETVIYEAHVKGMTMTHPEIPADVRGTYSGSGAPGDDRALHELGVTAVELMPVHQFVHDHVARRARA
jgi:glycogen operon protein